MWQETEQGLYKRFEFADFKQAFSFMTQVAALAESQQHHPRWMNEWNVVELWLSTHDADDRITDQDYQLARAIDRLERDR